jgi:hypothetical protein
LDMPQPINKMVPNPHVYLDPNVLKDKPDYAILVCQIFAVWASIEQELNFLFFVVLGADAAPAIAIYSELRTQALQSVALEAAARAALPADDYLIFKAAISVADAVQTPRNHLAHWAWGGCRQRPDVLALCDPKMIKERDFRVAKHLKSNPDIEKIDTLEVAVLHLFDDSGILGYTRKDLERSLRDLQAAAVILSALRYYLDPIPIEVMLKDHPHLRTETDTRDELLQTLNGHRLFREALARTHASQQSKAPAPDGQHPPPPDGSSKSGRRIGRASPIGAV